MRGEGLRTCLIRLGVRGHQGILRYGEERDVR